MQNIVGTEIVLLFLYLAHLSALVCVFVYELNRRLVTPDLHLRYPDSCRIIYVEFVLYSIDQKYRLKSLKGKNDYIFIKSKVHSIYVSI